MIPGSESEELVEKIAKFVDFEVGHLKTLKIRFRSRDLFVHSHITLVADNKTLTICCGSGGAVCISCTKTRADHMNFSNIRAGLPIDRTNEFLQDLCKKLKRTKKGTIATKTGKNYLID